MFEISTTEMTVPFNSAEQRTVSVSQLKYMAGGVEINRSDCIAYEEEGWSFYSNDDIANRDFVEGAQAQWFVNEFEEAPRTQRSIFEMSESKLTDADLSLFEEKKESGSQKNLAKNNFLPEMV